MDPAHIQRLKDEHIKNLQICEGKIVQWDKFKTDYEVLKELLEKIPDNLSSDITVPFGPNAFTLGKIVHTNEIMVLLGDNWFVEVSAKQATGIASRRIAQCLKMLHDLQKEKEQVSNWINYIDEVSGKEDLIEIVEKYDEAEEEKWREQHVKNVKAYRQKLAEAKKSSDTDVRQRLDSLELTEEESEPTSIAESDGSLYDCSDIGSQLSEEELHKYSPTELQFECGSEQKICSENGLKNADSLCQDSDAHNGSESNRNGKHVRWQDLSKLNIKKITFKHSKSKSKPQLIHQYSSESDDLSQSPSIIQSPSDIYKQFGTFFQNSPPKSILKVKNSPPIETQEGHTFLKESAENEEKKVEAFTGKVCEHSSPVHIAQKPSRPVSHFKSSRKYRKK